VYVCTVPVVHVYHGMVHVYSEYRPLPHSSTGVVEYGTGGIAILPTVLQYYRRY
jgi:hypothetical protein